MRNGLVRGSDRIREQRLQRAQRRHGESARMARLVAVQEMTGVDGLESTGSKLRGTGGAAVVI